MGLVFRAAWDTFLTPPGWFSWALSHIGQRCWAGSVDSDLCGSIANNHVSVRHCRSQRGRTTVPGRRVCPASVRTSGAAMRPMPLHSVYRRRSPSRRRRTDGVCQCSIHQEFHARADALPHQRRRTSYSGQHRQDGPCAARGGRTKDDGRRTPARSDGLWGSPAPAGSLPLRSGTAPVFRQQERPQQLLPRPSAKVGGSGGCGHVETASREFANGQANRQAGPLAQRQARFNLDVNKP